MNRFHRRMRGTGLGAVVVWASLLAGCGAAPSDSVGDSTEGVASGVYTLGTLAHSGSCMDAQSGGTTDGTQIQEWICNGTGAQSFELEDDGDGDGAVFLVNTQANKCVDVQGAGTANGTKIQLYDCNGTGAQKFVEQNAGSGAVYLVNANSNKCLDVKADSPNSGTVVQLYACNQTNAQKWKATAIGVTSGSSGGSGSGGSSSSGGSSGSGGSSSSGSAPIVPPATKAVMYLDNWSGSFASWATKIDFTKMTHLNLAFATVSGNNSWNDIGATSDVQTIVAAAHAKNVKVLVSIGGGGGDQTVISAYQSASNIAPLVASLDTMVKAMNLDGVDVDLESPGSMTSNSNYPAFVNQLTSTFHSEGKLVTTASAQYIVQGQDADATIVAAIKSFDFVNDMIYAANLSDYTNEAVWWTGSPVNLPKDKLVWGICFDGAGGGCGNPSVSTVQQITTASKAYGGVMVWDYTDTAVGPTMWPAIQSVL